MAAVNFLYLFQLCKHDSGIILWLWRDREKRASFLFADTAEEAKEKRMEKPRMKMKTNKRAKVVIDPARWLIFR